MSWRSLPSSYGEGERQFDMAKAAHDAAMPTVLLSAFLGQLIAAHFFGFFLGLTVGCGLYFLLRLPLDKRLKAAREQWQQDMRAYDEHIRDLG